MTAEARSRTVVTDGAAGTGGTRIPLNLSMLKAGISPIASFGKSEDAAITWHVWEDDHLTDLPQDEDDLVEAVMAGDVWVAVLDRPSRLPPWQVALREMLGLTDFGAPRRTQGLAIYCAVEHPETAALRWMVFTFGYASNSLHRRTVEPRFGLIAALNRLAVSQAADPGGHHEGTLRQAAYRTLGAYPSAAVYRASSDTPVEGFRLSRLTDSLSGAGGETGSSDSPDQVFGARSLRTRDEIAEVADLRGIAEDAFNEYLDDAYRDSFAFVDNRILVEDEATLAALRVGLFDAVVERRETVDVLMPDDLVALDDDRTISFIARPRQRLDRAADRVLTIDVVAQMLDGADVDALDAELRFADADLSLLGQASILECLVGEIEVDGSRYVTFDGDFYEVANDLAAYLRDELAGIPVTTPTLPCYLGGSERVWNETAESEEPRKYCLLDEKLVYLTGYTPFEVCDLLDSENGVLMHVKRKGRASAMSHLFTQALTSCQMLLEVPEARDEAIGKVTKRLGDGDSLAANAPDVIEALGTPGHGVSVALVLLGDWHNKSLENLPLLTKVIMIETVHAIRRMGFDVSVVLVSLCSRPTSA